MSYPKSFRFDPLVIGIVKGHQVPFDRIYIIDIYGQSRYAVAFEGFLSLAFPLEFSL